MAKSSDNSAMRSGHIDTTIIYDTHVQVKEIVEAYRQANSEVARITAEVNENWVGQGQTEFESQYKLLISKIDDFGEILQDIYNALVEAEASYEDADDDMRQDFVMAMNS